MLFQKGNRFGCKKNPNAGRKSRFTEEELQALFDSALPKKERRAVIRKMYEEAMAGNVDAARWLFDRCYGKARQTVQHQGSLGVEAINSWADIDALGIPRQQVVDETLRLLAEAAEVPEGEG